MARPRRVFFFVWLLLWTAGVEAASQARKGGVPKPAASPKPPGAAPAASRWLASLTLEQKAAQLVVIPVYGDAPHVRSREFQKYVRLVRDRQVGGLILINRVRQRALRRAEPFAFASFLNRMQKLARIPLMVAADFERGASMRVADTTAFPHAMAFAAAGDLEATREAGRLTALEARALGVHWVLFPTADVNSNPDNPVINIRSYGESPHTVAQHVAAFIEGARSDPRHRVLTTAKHFPGHGDTAVDSHVNLASIPGDRARLDAVELVPFRAAIRAGVDSIMTAHLSVPALDDPALPATLSARILTDLLRKELGFQGLIVTDALEMGGVAKGFAGGEAAVRALEAGADVLLMPPDPEAAIRAVARAVREKRLTEARLDQSLVRWFNAKQRLGLDRRREVAVEELEEILDSPEANASAQAVAQKAVTLLRNQNQALPLRPAEGACAVLLAENRYHPQGLVFAEEFSRRDAGATVVLLDPLMPQPELDAAAAQFGGCAKIVAAAFTSVASYRDGDVLPAGYPAFVESLLASGKPVVLVSLGNPYLLRRFGQVAGYLATYSPVPPSESAAVRVLFGEIQPEGKLPVTIPGLAKPGDGLTLP